MATQTQLGAHDLRALARAFRDALRAHQAHINRLNVYPVPDGDTGTNMALTMESVCAELDVVPADAPLPDVARAIGHGSLMGARGNSGVILSQILRALAEGCRAPALDCGVDGATLASALRAAATAAYGAVLTPVEGTVLTVAREAADAAVAAADAGGGLVEVAEAARAAGHDALSRTPQLLPVLADAGVVDAGGAGFVLLFDAALHVIDGRPLPPAPVVPHEPAGSAPAHVDAPAHGEATAAGPRYEVMFLLDAADDRMDRFKEAWSRLGDSIVVVGGDGLWNCHIHTDDIGGSIEAAIAEGRPHQIRVTDLHEQVEGRHEEPWAPAGDDDHRGGRAAPAQSVRTGVVAVATGDGLQRILRSLGVHEVVAGGQSMNPSTADLLAAVDACPAEQVVLLPNNKNIVPVAEQVVGLSAKQVRVVPTRSVPEAFAALVAYDPDEDVDVNASAMGAAAAGLVAGEVTRAVRDSSSPAGPIRAGDWLGLSRDGIRAVDATLAGAACALLEVLVAPGHEIVTVVEGEGASDADRRAIEAWMTEHRPGVAVEVHRGGQPLYPYLFGIE